MIYDASFAYEVAVIMQDAITRILGPDPEDRFWYLTLYNETYPMPALPEGQAGEDISRGIVDGIYRYSAGPEAGPIRRRLTPEQICAPRCVLGTDVERGPGGPAHSGRGLRRQCRHLGRDLMEPLAHRRLGGRALEPPPPRRSPAGPW